MTIAVIGGTGKEGRGLALRWAAAGQTVVIGSRQAEKAQATAAELNQIVGKDNVSGLANRDAAAAANVVVLSVPYAAHRDILADIRDACQGKVLIDVTVPLNPQDPKRIQVPPAGSATAEAQQVLGDGVRVVGAFHNVSAVKLPRLDQPLDCDVLVVGNDHAAKEVAMDLARLAGMAAYDAGALDNAVAVEGLTAILIGINVRYKVKGVGIHITGFPT
jgi:NADPH-dependent F420 reductase